MKQRFTALALLGAWLAGTVLTATPALAATAPAATTKPTAPAGQALEIAPPVISLTVNPGDTAKTVIYLRNISGSNLVVSNQLNDFVAAGQDGTPKLLLEDKANNPYTLKTWIAPLPSLTLVPREIKTLTVTIHVPANASPGGHYGVVRFTGTAAGLNTSGVSLSASLGSLLLVTVNGNISESLKVDQFSVNKGGGSSSHLFDSAPLNFVEIFKNTGNVHVQPTGVITVKNMFGKQVASVPVNVPPGNVLPASSRKFTQALDKSILGTKRLFGHYNAKLSVTYGTTKQTLTSSLGFWVIPLRLIIVIALVLVGGFLALRWLIKYYNRRVIERANRNRQQ
jgi:hypothetical protein